MGYFVDPSQWGKGNELDDLAYFLSDIRFYQGKDWFNSMIDRYIHHRSSHDKQFRSEVCFGNKRYLHDERLRLGALQQQLALRDSVMKKRIIELHRYERLGYHHHLEELTSHLINPKAHG